MLCIIHDTSLCARHKDFAPGTMTLRQAQRLCARLSRLPQWSPLAAVTSRSHVILYYIVLHYIVLHYIILYYINTIKYTG